MTADSDANRTAAIASTAVRRFQYSREVRLAQPLLYCNPIRNRGTYGNAIGGGMAEPTDVWQGTLAPMELKTLEVMGPP